MLATSTLRNLGVVGFWLWSYLPISWLISFSSFNRCTCCSKAARRSSTEDMMMAIVCIMSLKDEVFLSNLLTSNSELLLGSIDFFS